MAAYEREDEEESGKSSLRNNEEVLWGDLERRRPTKRQTTVRHFGIVKNWVGHNAPELKGSSRQNSPSLQSRHVSSRTGSLNVSSSSNRQPESHEPLSSQHVYSLLTDNDLDISPQKAPVVCLSSLELSLPGAAEVTPLKIFRKKSDESSETHEDDKNDEDDDEMVIIEKHTYTPEQNMASPQTGLQSGPTKRKVVAFDMNEKEENGDNGAEEEYKEQCFVRLFNADRGRKRSVADITDLDIILTNVEEIALKLRNDEDSPLCKKVIREAFIQLRQIFSNSIDVYKERKYLKSAVTKTNSKVKKMKQELVKEQAKRTRTRTKLEKLQSEYDKVERQRKAKEEANSFLTEFENLQERLRKTDQKQEKHCHEESLPLLLSEAHGYLSSHRQMKDMNDKLEKWLDKNDSLCRTEQQD